MTEEIADLDVGAESSAIDPDVKIDDDEYVRRRRLKSLNDSRERAIQAVQRSRQAHIIGEIREDTRDALTFAGVQGFIADALPTLEKVDGANKVIQKRSLGHWPVSPPLEVAAPSNSSISRSPSSNELKQALDQSFTAHPEHHAVEARGLKAVAFGEPKCKLEWVAEFEHPISADKTERVVTKTAVPSSVSLKAYKLTTDLLEAAGLNLQIHTEEDAGFDYSDILEEGPPGTGDVPDIVADGTGDD